MLYRVVKGVYIQQDESDAGLYTLQGGAGCILYRVVQVIFSIG